jgi:hypothetical protein
MTDECHYCHSTEKELRPYGPGGAMVCHPCATATPEREKQTEAAFYALLDGAEAISQTGIAAIGQESGPVPFEP